MTSLLVAIDPKPVEGDAATIAHEILHFMLLRAKFDHHDLKGIPGRLFTAPSISPDILKALRKSVPRSEKDDTLINEMMRIKNSMNKIICYLPNVNRLSIICCFFTCLAPFLSKAQNESIYFGWLTKKNQNNFASFGFDGNSFIGNFFLTESDEFSKFDTVTIDNQTLNLCSLNLEYDYGNLLLCCEADTFKIPSTFVSLKTKVGESKVAKLEKTYSFHLKATESWMRKNHRRRRKYITFKVGNYKIYIIKIVATICPCVLDNPFTGECTSVNMIKTIKKIEKISALEKKAVSQSSVVDKIIKKNTILPSCP